MMFANMLESITLSMIRASDDVERPRKYIAAAKPAMTEPIMYSTTDINPVLAFSPVVITVGFLSGRPGGL